MNTFFMTKRFRMVWLPCDVGRLLGGINVLLSAKSVDTKLEPYRPDYN